MFSNISPVTQYANQGALNIMRKFLTRTNFKKASFSIILIFVYQTIFFCDKIERTDLRVNDNFLSFYSNQSGVTDPGELAYLYEGVPDDIPGIVNAVQGVLILISQVENERISIPSGQIDKNINLVIVEKMLKSIADIDKRGLIEKRSKENRIVGICNHFAFLTTSILRHKKVPARVRGGFETYVSETRHHDHTICEYWSEEEKRWIKVDAEINQNMINNKNMNIDFDPLDVPDTAFLTGTLAWEKCRVGELNPNTFGIPDGRNWMGGWDFVLNQAVNDFLNINKREFLPWGGIDLGEKGYNNLSTEEIELVNKCSSLVHLGNESFNEMRDLYLSEKAFQ